MEIEFQGKYERNTIFKALSLISKPTKWKAVTRIGLIVLVFIVFIAYFIAIIDKGDLSTYEIIRAARHFILFPFIAYYFLKPYILPYFLTNKLLKDPVIQLPVTGFISEQGITFLYLSGNRKEIVWSSFVKKETRDDIIVLLAVDGVCSYFPRHFFKTNEDWNRVKQWVDFKVMEAK